MKAQLYPKLNNDPIIQAVLEIKLQFPVGFDVKRTKELSLKLQDLYPTVKEILQKELIIKENTERVKTKNYGFVFLNKSGQESFRIYQNQFDFFRSKPYDSWDNFKSEALNIWKELLKIVEPTKINQISTRFINRIKVEFNSKEISPIDYFKTYLNISDDLENNTEQFFIRYSSVDQDNHMLQHVTITTEDKDDDKVFFLLDIDVLTTDLEIEMKNLEPIFERLHDRKNHIFFNTITDKTLDLIK